MILSIKNMVCNRCKMAVQGLFEELGFQDYTVRIGTVTLSDEQLDGDSLVQIEMELHNFGFELIDDKKNKLIEAIKNIVVSKIHHGTLTDYQQNWSNLITDEIPYDYKYLSQLFTSIEGISIVQFTILQKIEKVKELMTYNELSLSEIAWELNYSSAAHLSNQFKNVTGMRPKDFKNLGNISRTPLDEV